MVKAEIEKLLEKNLNTLIGAAENSNRSGEELKSITEAIEINVCLLKKYDFVVSDSKSHYITKGKSITNPLTEN